jgi:polar amino acid transport system substrate-binding protein
VSIVTRGQSMTAKDTPNEAVLKDLAPTGKLRATINLGNTVLAQRHPDTGELDGISVDLAKALAKRLELELELHAFDTARTAFEALAGGYCDVGFLAIDPTRAEHLAFTAPYVVIEGTYLVPSSSELASIVDVDRAGIRIATGRSTAYDLFLTRTLEQATIVQAATSQAAIDLFLTGATDAVAGMRQPLAAIAAARPELRVLNGYFLEIRQAMAMLGGHEAGLSYLNAFIAHAKRSGLIAGSLRRTGQEEATIAS